MFRKYHPHFGLMKMKIHFSFLLT